MSWVLSVISLLLLRTKKMTNIPFKLCFCVLETDHLKCIFQTLSFCFIFSHSHLFFVWFTSRCFGTFRICVVNISSSNSLCGYMMATRGCQHPTDMFYYFCGQFISIKVKKTDCVRHIWAFILSEIRQKLISIFPFHVTYTY